MISGLLHIVIGFIGGSIGLALSILIRLEMALPGYVVSSGVSIFVILMVELIQAGLSMSHYLSSAILQ